MRRLYLPGLIVVPIVALLVAGCGRCNRCKGADPDVSARVRAAIGPTAAASSSSVRVQVALSLAEAVPAARVDEGCGLCLPLAEAETKARQASAPLVLFVGGCAGRAKEVLAGTTAVPARADRYDADATLRSGGPGDRRIVVLSPGDPTANGWVIEAVLPADAPAADVRAKLPTPRTMPPVRMQSLTVPTFSRPAIAVAPVRASAPAVCRT